MSRDLIIMLLVVHSLLPLFTINGYEIQKILPIDGSAGDQFGYGIAIDGNRAIIGAWQDDNGQGSQSGSAYYFQYNETIHSWVQQQKLIPNVGAAGDWFGMSVALDGEWAIIGSPKHNNNQGAAYVFHYNNSLLSWQQQSKLIADDGAANDLFSYRTALALQNQRAVVGAKGHGVGQVYIFEFGNSTKKWNQTAKLVSSDGQANDRFGNSVALDGNNIIVGAYMKDALATESGAAYIYTYNNGNWVEKTKLLANDGQVGDGFGNDVGISQNYAIVGAYWNDARGDAAGSVYFYYYNESTDQWPLLQTIYSNDINDYDYFGSRVSVDGETLAVSAYGDDDNKGSTYIFRMNEVNVIWEQTAKIVADDVATNDMFGVGLDLTGDNVIIGSRYHDDNGEDSGAGYMVRNYNDCNQTKTQVLDEEYLIDWHWTVCYTSAPTTAPSISPTSAPTISPSFAPTKPPTFSTTNPSTAPSMLPSSAPSTSPVSCIDMDTDIGNNKEGEY